MSDALPIDNALPELLDALRGHGRAVLEAPPGAGKTTRVPLAMLDAGLTKGKILMLEPRRLAARGAAERMAQTLGEKVGQTIGYRMRGVNKTSADTRVEVVTEGILTRMLQSDPELPGIGAVIFDEFHERSLNADFGLALCLEVADVLREDLILLAMSATLDAEPVAQLMNAPRVTSEGRAYPVEIQHLSRPLATSVRRTDAMADLIAEAYHDTRDLGGSVLAFLPGQAEITRVQSALSGAKLPQATVLPLYGALPFAKQQEAIKPLEKGRKIVLATSIAETSLTLPDVRVVVDMGLSRRARFDPNSGMSRLVTERATKAEITQRTGRAGRVSAGRSYRLWTAGEEGGMAAFPPPEIEAADLANLALEIAVWGSVDLPFLTPPPEGALSEARGLLRMLGALDEDGKITEHGQAIAPFPLHPRLAHMMIKAGPAAAEVAAVLNGPDFLGNGAPVDLELRVQALHDLKSFQQNKGLQVSRASYETCRSDVLRLRKLSSQVSERSKGLSHAEMAALAYPDRISQRRKGDAPRYLLSGGKGAILPAEDELAGAPFLVATDLDGNPREAKIRRAAPISLREIRALFSADIAAIKVCEWSSRDRKVVARDQERLGAIVLDDRIWKTASDDDVAAAMVQGVRDLGLNLTGRAKNLAARVELARLDGGDFPDFSEKSLLDRAEDWLQPMLRGVKTASDWKKFDVYPALYASLDWAQQQRLEQVSPAHFVTPLGRKIAIDYSGDVPEISVRLQEMFGVTTHPTSAGAPLKVTLLSPAQRPIQVTLDLPGFWRGSYADVRKDMRSQYPKHPWPDDPMSEDPTLRAKRRK